MSVFLMALVRPTEGRLIWAAAVAAACVALLHVPIVNIPFVLAAWPLSWCSRLARSGPDVEWYFFGPLLKSPRAFLVFFAYYAIMVYVLLFPLGYAADRERQRQEAAPASGVRSSGPMPRFVGDYP